MIPNIKYKTSLCKNWLDSTLWLYEDERCPKASNCYFAHGDRDLRTIEENTQDMALKHQWLLNYNCYGGYKPKELENYKTVRCKFFLRGECKLGDDCTFAHHSDEIRLKQSYSEYNNASTFYYYPSYGEYGYPLESHPFQEFSGFQLQHVDQPLEKVPEI